MRRSLCFMLCFFGMLFGHAQMPHTASFRSEGCAVTYKIFGDSPGAPVLILLHGASGPDVSPYPQQAALLARKGYTVFLLYYFNASPSTTHTYSNMLAWVQAVRDLVSQARAENSTRTVGLVGYSLGASVALAAGSQGVPVDAIAEWYGSLPDEFFQQFKTMPPLLILHGTFDSNIPIVNAEQLMRLCSIKSLACESHLYPGQDHGFSGASLDDADARTVDFFTRTFNRSPAKREPAATSSPRDTPARY
jgi:dienelactone hydrolase